MRRALPLAIAACLLAALAPAPARAGGLGQAISNERTTTVWAHPVLNGPVLVQPRSGARRVNRLHSHTEDGFREVYVVLRRYRDSGGRTWFKLRLPARPNGQQGWVSRKALGALRTVNTRLVIGRRALRAVFYRGGKRIWSAPVGVGAPGTPTPAGRFWIREGFRVSGNSIYGKFAFGTSAYSVLSDWPGGGVVGIHGTNQPQLIPGRPSHGCVRMRNADITWLASRLPIGTPVRIR